MANNFNNINKPTITFKFENIEAAKQFKSWMCGHGEQDYWQWMEIREGEKNGDITGIKFDYWKRGEVIEVKCGRLDKEDGE